jgi:hypothetical protein
LKQFSRIPRALESRRSFGEGVGLCISSTTCPPLSAPSPVAGRHDADGVLAQAGRWAVKEPVYSRRLFWNIGYQMPQAKVASVQITKWPGVSLFTLDHDKVRLIHPNS